MLCGYPPFEGETKALIFNRIMNQELDFDPDYWDWISDEAKDLLIRMLCKDPS